MTVPIRPSEFSPSSFGSSRRDVTALLAGVLALVGGAIVSPALAEPSVMAPVPDEPASGVRGNRAVASIAMRYVGKTGPQLGLSARLWCGEFASMVRRKAGLRAPSSRRAVDQAHFGRRVSRPVVGALLITSRRGGGHVDIITAVHADGTVTTVGGNVGRRVAERRRAPHGTIIIPT